MFTSLKYFRENFLDSPFGLHFEMRTFEMIASPVERILPRVLPPGNVRHMNGERDVFGARRRILPPLGLKLCNDPSGLHKRNLQEFPQAASAERNTAAQRKPKMRALLAYMVLWKCKNNGKKIWSKDLRIVQVPCRKLKLLTANWFLSFLYTKEIHYNTLEYGSQSRYSSLVTSSVDEIGLHTIDFAARLLLAEKAENGMRCGFKIMQLHLRYFNEVSYLEISQYSSPGPYILILLIDLARPRHILRDEERSSDIRQIRSRSRKERYACINPQGAKWSIRSWWIL